MSKFYTKKTITIKAIQWKGNNNNEVQEFVDKEDKVVEQDGYMIILQNSWKEGIKDGSVKKKITGGWHISTKVHLAVSVNDYIIKDEKGEVYSCEQSIFEASYNTYPIYDENGYYTLNPRYSEDEKILTKQLNTTGIIPLRTKVLIKLDDFADKTKGGIIIPDTSKRGTYRGVVIALGSYTRIDEKEEEPEYIRVGDRIEIREYDGIDIIDPEDRLMSKDIGKFRMVEYIEIISKVL